MEARREKDFSNQSVVVEAAGVAWRRACRGGSYFCGDLEDISIQPKRGAGSASFTAAIAIHRLRAHAR